MWFWQYKLNRVEPSVWLNGSKFKLRKETFNIKLAYLSTFETDYLKTKKILQKIGEEKWILILSKADITVKRLCNFSFTVSIHGKSQAGVLQNANYYQAFKWLLTVVKVKTLVEKKWMGTTEKRQIVCALLIWFCGNLATFLFQKDDINL